MTDAELDSRIAELALTSGVISEAVITRARAFQIERKCTLVGALVALHLASSQDVQKLLQEATGIRAVDPSLMTVHDSFIERINVLLPREVMRPMLAFPVQAERNAIHVCLPNPTDGWSCQVLATLSGCQIVPAIAHEAALAGVVERHYPASEPVAFAPIAAREAAEQVYQRQMAAPFENYLKPAVALINRSRDAIERDPNAIEALIREPAIIRVVQQILARAIECGASDIHFEPTDGYVRVRVRVDGAMRTQWTIPSNAARIMAARLKAVADLPTNPATVPLDARISCDVVWGRAVDLRFSLAPAVAGETIVLRILDRSRKRRGLADLGIDDRCRTEIEAGADLPSGLILVTGPTGSGKTSTLYAVLDKLNDETVSIITAEDPVESQIHGVTQVTCEETSGVTFSSALRSFLRQDPDVIMVGEIRDAGTADMALKAALTGHLVLSTLHTNDAPGAILRLLNMQLEPFVVASALRLVVAQRLLRRLCRSCRRPIDICGDRVLRLAGCLPRDAAEKVQNGTVYEPVGCGDCGGLGYRGRTGIFEVLRVTDAIEQLILARGTTAAIRAAATRDGMRTLRHAGWEKVAQGETSVSEVLVHTVDDDCAVNRRDW